MSVKVSPIDITGIEKAALLAALYNGAKTGGAADAFNTRTAPMTRGEAQGIIDKTRGPLCFTHIKGRAVRVDISGDSFNPEKYDQDHGRKAAGKIIAAMRGQPSQPQPVAKSLTTAALRA